MARKPMPLDVDAWLSSVRIMQLTPAEEGGYIRLLCCAWATGDCTLPVEPRELAALSRITDPASLLKLRDLFTVTEKGRLINERQHKDFVRIMTGAKPGRKKNGAPSRVVDGIPRGQFVVVSEADHAKLIEKHGKEKTEHAYEILDNYFGADERRLAKYTSHYRCILAWVLDCEKMRQRFPPAAPVVQKPAGPKCPKCQGPLASNVCGKCKIDYSPKRR